MRLSYAIEYSRVSNQYRRDQASWLVVAACQLSYGHDLARELRAVGFNLDKRAQAIGVSRDWVAVAQDRDVWRRVMAEGLCSCLDNEDRTSYQAWPRPV